MFSGVKGGVGKPQLSNMFHIFISPDTHLQSHHHAHAHPHLPLKGWMGVRMVSDGGAFHRSPAARP